MKRLAEKNKLNIKRPKGEMFGAVHLHISYIKD